MAPTVSVVIPVYCSELSIEELVRRVGSTLQGITEQYEIILVNDGSHDNSWQILSNLAKSNASVVALNLLRNFGQHNALLCGIREAQFEFIVTLDDDLQHPPEAIPRLLEVLNQGFDVVYGSPAIETHDRFRNFASRALKRALKMGMQIDIAEHASAFRAFRTRLRDAAAGFESPFVCLDVLLSWGTSNFTCITVDHSPRRYGHSGYGLKRLTIHAINMITGFSVVPLHVVCILGFCLTALGAAMLLFVIGRYIWEGGSVPGFPFLASSLAIFSGAQLFALGIIGEYLARMHFRLMGRPVYVVRERIGGAR